MADRNRMKALCRALLVTTFVVLVLLVPMTLLYVGTKQPGLDLARSLAGGWTLEPFIRIITGTGISEELFRESLQRSIIFASIVSFLATLVAALYTNRIVGWERKTAIGVSFTLLCFTLLPQTYLILPILSFVAKTIQRPPEALMITVTLLVGLVPLSAWMLHVAEGERIKMLQEQCALDRMNAYRSIRAIIRESRMYLFLLMLFAWTLAWGNYVIPFALGSRSTYTAVVQVATFTTNLGRDWAMIAAAGTIVCIPGLFLGGVMGVILWRLRRF